MGDRRNSRISASSELADLVDRLTERQLAGKPINWEAIARKYPEHIEDLRRLWPTVGVLGAFSGKQTPAELEESVLGQLESGVLGDFRLLQEVGRGGMGVVFEAEQISLDRRVALKVLPFAATMDPRQLQRFRNEARAAASLEHPHIVPVYGVGCERGVHYYAMKFIDGQSLAQFIDKKSRSASSGSPVRKDKTGVEKDRTVSHPSKGKKSEPDGRKNKATAVGTPSKSTAVAQNTKANAGLRGKGYIRNVVRMGIEAAEALEHAHSLGIVHRDIKPANLMLDGEGKLWVTDFGLARTASDSGLTMTGDLLGTLRYMSPEQALAEHGLVDHRTDIYALGVTLYELATLRPAIEGEGRKEILDFIANKEPRTPRASAPDLPADLETVISKAMSKDIGERYRSAREFAEDLRRILDCRPILATKPGLGQKLTKWAQRNRRGLFAGLVGMSILLMALSLFLVHLWHQNRKLESAYEAETNARRDEEKQRLRAEERFRSAGQTIDRLYLGILPKENDVRGPKPNQEQQRMSLTEMLEYYRRFKECTDTDPTALFEAAYATRRMGEIQAQLARFVMDPAASLSLEEYQERKNQEAEESLREALARSEKLAARFPEEARFRLELARASTSLGAYLLARPDAMIHRSEMQKLFSRSQELLASEGAGPVDFETKEALLQANAWLTLIHQFRTYETKGAEKAETENAWRRLVDLTQEMEAERTSQDLREKLILFLGNQRRFHKMWGTPQQLEGVSERERKTIENLMKRFPRDYSYPVHLVQYWLERGDWMKEVRKTGEAEACYRQALSLADKLAAAKNATTKQRVCIATAYSRLGRFFGDEKRMEESEKAFLQAISHAEKLVSEDPSSEPCRSALLTNWKDLATLRIRAGRTKDAIDAYYRTNDILEGMVAHWDMEDHVRWLAKNRKTLIDLLLLENRGAEAVDLQKTALRQLEMDERRNRTIHSLQMLAKGGLEYADILRKAGREKEAEQVQRMAVSNYEKSVDLPEYLPDRLWFDRCRDMYLLVTLNLDLGEKEQARSWYDKGVSLAASHFDPKNPSLNERARRMWNQAAGLLGLEMKPLPKEK